MKAFLEEYGLVIVVVIVIAALLGVGTFISTDGQNQLKGTFNEFSVIANNALDTARGEQPTTAGENP